MTLIQGREIEFTKHYLGMPWAVLLLLLLLLASLWLIKQVRGRNDHMSDLDELLNTHFEEGEKLLNEYR